MKFKVVVIDDKPFIRTAIIKTIDWDSLGCFVAGEATDGTEGREIILKTQPDIIITDIKMPGLSGLELVEFVKPSLPSSKVILITGYQEFEYAQKAVKLGVFDFILKPISNKELYDVVARAVNEIKKELERKKVLEKSAKIEKLYKSSLPDLQRKMILDRINGIEPSGENSHVGFEDINCNTDRYFLVLLKSESVSTQDRKYLFDKVVSCAHARKQLYNIEILDVIIGNDLVFVMFFKEAISAKKAKLNAERYLNSINHEISQDICDKYHITVSSLYTSMNHLNQAYTEASSIMNTHFFENTRGIKFSESETSHKVLEKTSIISDLDSFYEILEQPENQEIAERLETLVQNIGIFSNGDIFIAKTLLSEICITTARYYYRKSGNETGLTKTVDEILSDISRLQDITQAVNYLKEFICNIKSRQMAESNYSLIVQKVIKYIGDHYWEDISLKKVAELFSTNASYLSRLIKKETGENYVDIVSRTRIEVSKKLLKDPQNRINEVAEAVGYKDYAYFYQVFKKFEGISPSEYKRISKKI